MQTDHPCTPVIMTQKNMIKCAICCTPIMASYLFAAIAIGFIGSEECPTIDSDDTLIIDPTLYLKIGGFSFLGLSLLTTCTRFTFCKSREYEDFVPSKGQSCLSFAAILLETVWIVFGCVIYHSVDADCKESPVGKMILSFVIIAALLNCCECGLIAQSCIARKEPEAQRLNSV